MARIIGEVRPRYIYVENSPLLTSRGIHRVLGDLAEMGFDARWGVVSAATVGAPHKRDRIWIVGKATYAASNRPQEQTYERVLEGQGRGELQPSQPRNTKEMAYADSQYAQGQQPSGYSQRWQRPFMGQLALRGGTSDRHGWEIEPNVGRVADGVAARVDRLKSIGNGQVPLCAATAWRILSE